MGPIALREQTAGRLLRRLGEVPGGAGGRGAGVGGGAAVLVRCTGDEPAAGSGVGAECYPGVVIRNKAMLEVADQEDAGEVWLTPLLGEESAEPAIGALYWCQLAGPVEIGDETRPRAFGVGPTAIEYHTDTNGIASGDLNGSGGAGTEDYSGPLATVEPGTWLVVAVVRVALSCATGGVAWLDMELNRDVVGGAGGGNNISQGVRLTKLANNSDDHAVQTLAGVVTLTDPAQFFIRGRAMNGTTASGGSWSMTVRPFFCYRLAGAPAGAGGGFSFSYP